MPTLIEIRHNFGINPAANSRLTSIAQAAQALHDSIFRTLDRSLPFQANTMRVLTTLFRPSQPTDQEDILSICRTGYLTEVLGCIAEGLQGRGESAEATKKYFQNGIGVLQDFQKRSGRLLDPLPEFCGLDRREAFGAKIDTLIGALSENGRVSDDLEIVANPEERKEIISILSELRLWGLLEIQNPKEPFKLCLELATRVVRLIHDFGEAGLSLLREQMEWQVKDLQESLQVPLPNLFGRLLMQELMVPLLDMTNLEALIGPRKNDKLTEHQKLDISLFSAFGVSWPELGDLVVVIQSFDHGTERLSHRLQSMVIASVQAATRADFSFDERVGLYRVLRSTPELVEMYGAVKRELPDADVCMARFVRSLLLSGAPSAPGSGLGVSEWNRKQLGVLTRDFWTKPGELKRSFKLTLAHLLKNPEIDFARPEKHLAEVMTVLAFAKEIAESHVVAVAAIDYLRVGHSLKASAAIELFGRLEERGQISACLEELGRQEVSGDTTILGLVEAVFRQTRSKEKKIVDTSTSKSGGSTKKGTVPTRCDQMLKQLRVIEQAEIVVFKQFDQIVRPLDKLNDLSEHDVIKLVNLWSTTRDRKMWTFFAGGNGTLKFMLDTFAQGEAGFRDLLESVEEADNAFAFLQTQYLGGERREFPTVPLDQEGAGVGVSMLGQIIRFPELPKGTKQIMVVAYVLDHRKRNSWQQEYPRYTWVFKSPEEFLNLRKPPADTLCILCTRCLSHNVSEFADSRWPRDSYALWGYNLSMLFKKILVP